MKTASCIFLAINFLYLSVDLGLTELVLSSINIISKNASIIKCKSKLEITFSPSDPIFFVNTGSALENYPATTKSRSELYGFVLGSCKYRFGKARFSINDNIYGNTGLTIDGIGAPALIDLFYFNTKYESLQEAVSKPDGIVVLRELIKVENKPNLAFAPLQCLLEKIVKPGCSVETKTSIAYYWINVISLITDYYQYRGLFCYGKGLTNYATVLVSPLKTATVVSKEQFTAFQKLKGFNGQPLTGEIPNFKQCSAKVNHIFGPVGYLVLPN